MFEIFILLPLRAAKNCKVNYYWYFYFMSYVSKSNTMEKIITSEVDTEMSNNKL
jgi:hypothetical protein